jgi:hypothetical protein
MAQRLQSFIGYVRVSALAYRIRGELFRCDPRCQTFHALFQIHRVVHHGHFPLHWLSVYRFQILRNEYQQILRRHEYFPRHLFQSVRYISAHTTKKIARAVFNIRVDNALSNDRSNG